MLVEILMAVHNFYHP